MKSLKTKIIFIIVFSILFPSICIPLLSYFSAYNSFNKNMENDLRNISHKTIDSFTEMFVDIEQTVEVISNIVKQTFDLQKVKTNKEYFTSYLNTFDPIIKTIGETTKGVIGSYIDFGPFFDKEYFYVWYAKDKEDKFKKLFLYKAIDYNEKSLDMEWFYKPIRLKKGCWSEVYKDKYLNIDMITYTAPVFINGTFVCIIGFDLDYNIFRNYLKNIRIYESGYSFLLSTNGNFLYHPKYSYNENITSIENGKYKELFEEIKNNESGFIKYTFNNQEKVMSYETLSNGFVMCISVPYREVYKPIILFRTLITLFTTFILIIAFIISISFTKSTIGSFNQLIEIINRLISFDFSNNYEFKINKNISIEIRKVFDSIIKLINVINYSISNIKGYSKNVLLSSNELINSIREGSYAIDEIAKASNQLAENSYSQVSLSKSILDYFNIFSSIISKTAEYSEFTKK